jgi:cell division protein FtsL
MGLYYLFGLFLSIKHKEPSSNRVRLAQKRVEMVKVVLIIIIAFMAMLLAASFIAKYLFNQKVKKEVEELFSKIDNKGEIVTKEDISTLPQNVGKWLSILEL